MADAWSAFGRDMSSYSMRFPRFLQSTKLCVPLVSMFSTQNDRLQNLLMSHLLFTFTEMSLFWPVAPCFGSPVAACRCHRVILWLLAVTCFACFVLLVVENAEAHRQAKGTGAGTRDMISIDTSMIVKGEMEADGLADGRLESPGGCW